MNQNKQTKIYLILSLLLMRQSYGVEQSAAEKYQARIKAEASDSTKGDWVGYIPCVLPIVDENKPAQSTYMLFKNETHTKCVSETFGKSMSMSVPDEKICAVGAPICEKLNTYDSAFQGYFKKKKASVPYLYLVDDNKRNIVTVWSAFVDKDVKLESCIGLAKTLTKNKAQCISPKEK